MSTRIDALKYNVHSCYQNNSVETNKKISEKLSLPVHLMLFNLDGNMNIAMSIRTAAVLGCSDVWIIGKRHYDARPEVGAKNYINIHKLENINPTTFFAERGIQPFIVEQGGNAIETFKFVSVFQKQPVCFIVGNESTGFDKEWLLLAESAGIQKLSITQFGMVRSLNVSIASSIVLYEYIKQLSFA